MSIVGIDLSLTSTGMARISGGGALGAVVEVESIPTKGHRADTLWTRRTRLQAIAQQVVDYAGRAELVVVEGFFPARHGSPLDRCGLWWDVVGRLLDRGVPVLEVAPTLAKKWATNAGNADKAAVAVAAARLWPNVDLANSDQADALILASIGMQLHGRLPGDIPKYRLAAAASLRVPNGGLEDAA